MGKNRSFRGFYCRRCGGRVMEDEIYSEVDPSTRKKVTKVELTCILCARSSRCKLEDYEKLLDNIERIIKQKISIKISQKSLLSSPTQIG